MAVTPKEFVDYINDELKERSWSQNYLAEKADLGSGVLSRVLNGYRPGVKVCKAIAHALDVPEQKILRLAGHLRPEPPNVPRDMDEWMDIFQKAKPEDRPKLMRLAKETLKVLRGG